MNIDVHSFLHQLPNGYGVDTDWKDTRHFDRPKTVRSRAEAHDRDTLSIVRSQSRRSACCVFILVLVFFVVYFLTEVPSVSCPIWVPLCDDTFGPVHQSVGECFSRRHVQPAIKGAKGQRSKNLHVLQAALLLARDRDRSVEIVEDGGPAVLFQRELVAMTENATHHGAAAP